MLTSINTIKASGDEVVVTLKHANAEFPYLMTDYHLIIQPNGGKDNPAAGISAGPYKVTANEPGVRYSGGRFANFWEPDEMGFADLVEIVAINNTRPASDPVGDKVDRNRQCGDSYGGASAAGVTPNATFAAMEDDSDTTILPTRNRKRSESQGRGARC